MQDLQPASLHVCKFRDISLNVIRRTVWISPVSQNYEGPRTAYGDAYHGYWVADVTLLNDRFGTSDDLKALSAELHRRNMYVLDLHSSCLATLI
jgi:maltooligosyltrehalose synthase